MIKRWYCFYLHLKNLESGCKDLEKWCMYKPTCDTEVVLRKCPLWCGTCDGKFNIKRLLLIEYSKSSSKDGLPIFASNNQNLI